MRTQLDRNLIPLALAVISLCVGCSDDRSSIRRYQVPHEENTLPAAATAPTSSNQRTIAALIPNADEAWFFKMTGVSDELQAAVADFNSVVSSVRFDGETPDWELPQGWARDPGNQFRFATLRRGSTQISVSKLPLPPDDVDGYVLANINRWRGQIMLPPVTKAQLPKITKSVELSDRSAIIYDSGPTVSSPARPQATSGNSSPISYEAPDGWREEGRRPMRLVTFTVERDEKKIEILLSQLGPSAGSLVANVNRWRGQIGLGSADEGDINNDFKSIEVDGNEAKYIQIVAEDTNQVIFVVIVQRPDLTLFVKLTGDRTLAEAETANFEAFARSIRFSS